nr:XK-related protein 9 isoform X1 [Zootoca vivipara]XP_034981910.1 XK-related protein 9 isoform X1 [Zootoca vivipara]
MRYTKQEFATMVLGMVVYVADVGADLWAANKYFHEGQYLWCALTLATGLLSSLVVQYFSYTWFKDDGTDQLSWISSLHLLQAGIFTRYWVALKCGYQAAFKTNNSEDGLIDGCTSPIHKSAICAMTDISMLRLFKAFLESTPQLILQIYILMTCDSSTPSQYVTIATSFCSISCATVDYQIALRKSLPEKKNFPGIFSKLMYLFYKLLTLTSWILCIALVTILSIASLVLLVFLWLLSICWVLKQHTAFCTSKGPEIVYRTIVGIILIFTFFNVKGEKTKIPLTVYYTARGFITATIVCVCVSCKSVFNGKIHLLSVIMVVVITLILGIIFLISYYAFFHPRNFYTQDVVDGPGIYYAQDVVDGPGIYYTQEVIDGPGSERTENCRMRGFLMQ